MHEFPPIPPLHINFNIIIYVHMQSLVSSDYILSIIIEDFSNPTNQNANGSCCADLSQMSGCLQSCNERMNLCLREAGHPANDTTNCSLFKTNSIDINLKTLNLPTMSGPWPVVCGHIFSEA